MRRVALLAALVAACGMPVAAWAGPPPVRGNLVGTRDLVASRSINKPGLVSGLGWYAGGTFHHLAGLL